jgi:phosphohistidine phosphatase
MKQLTLIRHAKSSWSYPDLSDFERPLNERGRRDAPRMALRAASVLPKISRWLSSPATRTISTTRLICETLGVDFDAVQIDPRIYDASRKTLMEVLSTLPNGVVHAVLVGHNPGLSELAHTLAACEFDDLPTSAVVHLELNIPNWAGLKPNCGVLRHYLFPKDGRN